MVGDHVHAREVIDVVAERRPGMQQDRSRRDGGQHGEQRGDLAGAEMTGAGGEPSFGAAGLRCRRHRWTRLPRPAQPEEMTDINHLRAAR